MNKKKLLTLLGSICLVSILAALPFMAAYAEEEPTEVAPVLIIGAIYVGTITDAGFNQAMHESMMAIERNIKGVKIIEAENVAGMGDSAQVDASPKSTWRSGAILMHSPSMKKFSPATSFGKGPAIRSSRRCMGVFSEASQNSSACSVTR